MALTHYAKLYQEKTTPPGVPNYLWDEVNSLFRAGKVAFLFDWPGWYALVKESDVGDKFDLAMYPKGPANKIAVWSGSHAFGVNRYSKNQEAAVALVKVLTSAPALYFEAKNTGAIPTRRSSLWTNIIYPCLRLDGGRGYRMPSGLRLRKQFSDRSRRKKHSTRSPRKLGKS